MPTSMTFNVLQLDDLIPAVEAHFNAQAQNPRTFRTGELPKRPGVYVWTRPDDSAVVYIGSGKSLARRLGDELRWVRRHDPDSWTETVLLMLHEHQATPFWIETDTHSEAAQLERDLIEWHRACVGTAPLAVGWDVKEGTRTGDAQRRMRALWRTVHGRDAA